MANLLKRAYWKIIPLHRRGLASLKNEEADLEARIRQGSELKRKLHSDYARKKKELEGTARGLKGIYWERVFARHKAAHEKAYGKLDAKYTALSSRLSKLQEHVRSRNKHKGRNIPVPPSMD